MTFEAPVSALRETVYAAVRNRSLTFVQPAPVLARPADAASLPWDQVDVLVPNEVEAYALLDEGRDGAIDDLAGVLSHSLGVPTVAVTLGASGCALRAGGVTRHYQAHQAVAVDTTGAGDAFMATFAAYFTAGATVAYAVNAAQIAAATVVQRAGGYDSMPTLAPIEQSAARSLDA